MKTAALEETKEVAKIAIPAPEEVVPTAWAICSRDSRYSSLICSGIFSFIVLTCNLFPLVSVRRYSSTNFIVRIVPTGIK